MSKAHLLPPLARPEYDPPVRLPTLEDVMIVLACLGTLGWILLTMRGAVVAVTMWGAPACP